MRFIKKSYLPREVYPDFSKKPFANGIMLGASTSIINLFAIGVTTHADDLPMLDERHVITSHFLAALKRIDPADHPRPESLRDETALVLLAAYYFYRDTHDEDIGASAGAFFTGNTLRISLDNELNFIKLWRDLVEDLCRWCRIDNNVLRPDTPPNDLVRELSSLISHVLENEQPITLRYVFGKTYELTRQSRLGLRVGDRSALAELASAFTRYANTFSELSAWSGAVACMAGNQRGSRYLSQRGTGGDMLWHVRFALFNVQIESVGEPLGTAPASTPDILILDSPSAVADIYRRAHPGRRPPSYWLNYLIDQDVRLPLCLVIVSNGARSKKGRNFEVRRQLIQSGQLLAVIDLPARVTQPNGERSVWIVSTPRQSAQDIVMLDARALQAVGEARSDQALMRLAGEIVALGIGLEAGEETPTELMEEERIQVRTLIRREFPSGYIAVDGVTARVDSWKVAERGYDLSTRSYLGSSHLTRGAFAGLDIGSIVEGLQWRGIRPRRFYVIGNNGEGKSLMLRRLVPEIYAMQKGAVGIAFGSTDRFDLAAGRDVSTGFKYMGARTSERTISLARNVARISELFAEIAVDQFRISAFLDALERVGFSGDMYLIPSGAAHSGVQLEAWYAAVARVSSNAHENMSLIAQRKPKEYQLAFKRHGQAGAIIPISELSSGEQHIVGLVLKLVVSAGSDRIVLLDEPETSMHVSWQRAVPELLAAISEAFNCDMVVATHSAVIIASVMRDEDRCFVASEGTLSEVEKVARRSVDGTLLDGFKTYTPNNRELYEHCAKAVAKAVGMANSTELTPQAQAKLLTELAELKAIVEQDRTEGALVVRARDLNLIDKASLAIIELFEKRDALDDFDHSIS